MHKHIVALAFTLATLTRADFDPCLRGNAPVLLRWFSHGVVLLDCLLQQRRLPQYHHAQRGIRHHPWPPQWRPVLHRLLRCPSHRMHPLRSDGRSGLIEMLTRTAAFGPLFVI